MCDRATGPLCDLCTAEIMPTWFWWKDVPPDYRISGKYLTPYYYAEKYFKRLKSVLQPNRCRAATLFRADDRKWIPCGRPSVGKDLCKVHLRSYETGAVASGVATKWREVFRTLNKGHSG